MDKGPLKRRLEQDNTEIVPGFHNFSVLCYLNSVLQLLFSLDNSLETLNEIDTDAEVLGEFVRLAKEYKSSLNHHTVLRSENFAKVLIKSSGFLTEGQNDVSEAFLVLLDSDNMDKSYQQQFTGKHKNIVMCMHCDHLSKRLEDFTSIMLHVPPDLSKTPTIGNLITNFTSQEVLLPGEEYDCDKCGKKSRAIKKLGMIFLKYRFLF